MKTSKTKPSLVNAAAYKKPAVILYTIECNCFRAVVRASELDKYVNDMLDRGAPIDYIKIRIGSLIP